MTPCLSTVHSNFKDHTPAVAPSSRQMQRRAPNCRQCMQRRRWLSAPWRKTAAAPAQSPPPLGSCACPPGCAAVRSYQRLQHVPYVKMHRNSFLGDQQQHKALGSTGITVGSHEQTATASLEPHCHVLHHKGRARQRPPICGTPEVPGSAVEVKEAAKCQTRQTGMANPRAYAWVSEAEPVRLH